MPWKITETALSLSHPVWDSQSQWSHWQSLSHCNQSPTHWFTLDSTFSILWGCERFHVQCVNRQSCLKMFFLAGSLLMLWDDSSTAARLWGLSNLNKSLTFHMRKSVFTLFPSEMFLFTSHFWMKHHALMHAASGWCYELTSPPVWLPGASRPQGRSGPARRGCSLDTDSFKQPKPRLRGLYNLHYKTHIQQESKRMITSNQSGKSSSSSRAVI